jgi:anti-sigma-K factor RskA
MKPCSKNRKLIAWLVLGTLDARKAATLREHLALCEECRRYQDEFLDISEKLMAAKPNSNIQASESFHRRVAEKLQAVGSGSALAGLAAHFREAMINWRVALPATAALMIAVFGLIILRQHPVVSPPAPHTDQVASASSPESDLAPTIANYQMVANQSLDKLDELLTRQGNKRLPPAPVYTASMYKLAGASF